MERLSCGMCNIVSFLSWYVYACRHILNDNDIFGKGKEYVICYELQHCGFVHACIILWIHEMICKEQTNEIVVVILIVYNEKIPNFIPPSLQLKLFKSVLQKSIHGTPFVHQGSAFSACYLETKQLTFFEVILPRFFRAFAERLCVSQGWHFCWNSVQLFTLLRKKFIPAFNYFCSLSVGDN